jgi:hypothetical protein
MADTGTAGAHAGLPAERRVTHPCKFTGEIPVLCLVSKSEKLRHNFGIVPPKSSFSEGNQGLCLM